MYFRIHKTDSRLEIRSFPLVPLGFCLVVLLGVLYSAFTRSPKLADIAIPLFCVGVFVSLLEYKTAVLSKDDDSIAIESRRLIGRKSQRLSFGDITEVSTTRGRGASSHAGVVVLEQSSGDKTSITSMAALSNKAQWQVVQEVKRFIGLYKEA